MRSFPASEIPADWSVDLQVPGRDRLLIGEREEMEADQPPFAVGHRYAELVMPGPADRDPEQCVEVVAVMLRELDLEEEQVDEVARHLAAEPSGPVSFRPFEAPAGWDAMDVWLFTSVMPTACRKGCPYSVRAARVLASADAFVVVWREQSCDPEWKPEEYPASLPERIRRHSFRVRVTGGDPASEGARLIQDVLQHHEWSVKQLTYRLEAWEARFYEQARSPGTLFQGIDIAELREGLASIASASLALRGAVRDLARRADLDDHLIAPVAHCEDIRGEVAERAAAIERRLVDLGAGIRDAFALLASVASGSQVEFQHAFTSAATLVAAFVLIPGLVVGLYGAEVDGLPGYSDRDGLEYILAYSAIGALTTLGLMDALRRAARKRAALMGALGIGAIVAVTVPA